MITPSPLASSSLPAPAAEGGMILIAVCSCRAYHAKRQVVRDTWMKSLPPGIRAVFFVGDGEGEVEDDVFVVEGAPDDYDHLPAKVRAFFGQALADPDIGAFDWLFKCDDDTYIAADRLIGLTRLGYEHVGDAEFTPTRRAASGGAGYLLSRRLVGLLAASDGLPDTGPEDVILSGEAVELCGGRCLATRRLSHKAGCYPRWDNDLVTSHWLNEARMRAIHTLCSGPPWHVMTISNGYWQDQLGFYEDGTFSRFSCDDGGVWDLEDGTIELRWFDYPAERVKVDSGGKGPERIVVGLHGGLGHQMFQYACGLSLARAFGAELAACWCPGGREFRLAGFGVKLISLPSETSLEKDPDEGDAVVAERRIWNRLNSMHGGVAGLEGYFQNERFFCRAKDEVFDFFLASLTPRRPVVPDGCRPVGVHVRRGDFVGHPRHEVCDISYFIEAMEHLRKEIARPFFLIVSDDPEWCSANFAGEDVRIVAGGDCFGDFETLLGCEAHVISNSAFSWWAAYLAERIAERADPPSRHLVVAPDRFLNHISWQVIPDRWHRLKTRGNLRWRHLQETDGPGDCSGNPFPSDTPAGRVTTGDRHLEEPELSTNIS